MATAQEAGQRLDRFLAARLPGSSRSFLQGLVRAGRVTMGGHALKSSLLIGAGDVVQVEIPDPEPLDLTPEPAALDVLHDDGDLIVLNKPAGLTVHPGAGARTGTLVHRLLHHCRDLSGIGGVERPGIVHRLDKDTSGVIVVAKNDLAHRDLIRQFQARTVEKTYEAIVWGHVEKTRGVVEIPIGRDRRDRVRISPRSASPRQALTQYEVVERLSGFTWVRVHPRTGRTHQIRVHMNHLGHPIVGDQLYGGTGRARRITDPERRHAVEGFGRLALHARRIAFVHPRLGEPVSYEAPLPPEFTALASALRSAA